MEDVKYNLPGHYILQINKGNKYMPEKRRPKLIGYCVMDSKGRITMPHKERKGIVGYLVFKYDDILILIDPRKIEGE